MRITLIGFLIKKYVTFSAGGFAPHGTATVRESDATFAGGKASPETRCKSVQCAIGLPACRQPTRAAPGRRSLLSYERRRQSARVLSGNSPQAILLSFTRGSFP
jgi:hypothetical protein